LFVLVVALTTQRKAEEASTMLPPLARGSLHSVASVRWGVVRPVSQSLGRWFSANAKSDKKDVTKEASTPAVDDKAEDYSDKLYEKLPITFADISRAEVAIRGGVKRTYCEHSPFISELVGANVYFKPEFRQFTGSFKERGARNAILQLMREQKDSLCGVIAASAGNHAQALAYHGKLLGVQVTVVMPTVAPMSKVDKCRVSDSFLAFLSCKQPLCV
jgi:threonine dehydratase